MAALGKEESVWFGQRVLGAEGVLSEERSLSRQELASNAKMSFDVFRHHRRKLQIPRHDQSSSTKASSHRYAADSTRAPSWSAKAYPLDPESRSRSVMRNPPRDSCVVCKAVRRGFPLMRRSSPRSRFDSSRHTTCFLARHMHLSLRSFFALLHMLSRSAENRFAWRLPSPRFARRAFLALAR